MQAARGDNVSTRQNETGSGGNGASVRGNGAAPKSPSFSSNGSGSSNGSSSGTRVQGTDLLEKPYSNNGSGNGASLSGNGAAYSKQGSAAQRRETAVADALQDAVKLEEDAEAQDDPCASGHLTECAVSRSMDQEAASAVQSAASASQQEAAVQKAAQSPRAKAATSGGQGNRWSKVGRSSTIQVHIDCFCHCVKSVHLLMLRSLTKCKNECCKYASVLAEHEGALCTAA